MMRLGGLIFEKYDSPKVRAFSLIKIKILIFPS